MVTSPVVDTEDLGRCCFDRRESSRRNPRARFIRRSFLDGKMSVDRLSDSDRQVLRLVHDEEASRRNPPRTFHGWYVFRADSVRSVGWDISPDPTPKNPWHSEVVRPESLEDEDEFLQNCSKIASQSRWVDRPMSQEIEEFLEQASDMLD